jgi:thioredoxin-like negative regulator of GroEL
MARDCIGRILVSPMRSLHERIAPTVKALAQERAGLINVVTVNVDSESSLASRFQIQSTPFMMLYGNGNKISEIAGALPKEQLEAWIDSSLLG